jgi:hypothetical protein
VAWGFAKLFESPVILIMSTTTAPVENRHSLRKLRAFTYDPLLPAPGPPPEDLQQRWGPEALFKSNERPARWEEPERLPIVNLSGPSV